MANSWENYNQSHSTSQQSIVLPGYLSGSPRLKNGLPGKPMCTHYKKPGHTESNCSNKLGTSKQRPPNNQNSSSSTSTQSSPLTVTIVEPQVTTPWGTLPHRLGVVSGIRPEVEFLPGQDFVWGSPSPTPLHSPASSTMEASTVESPTKSTATLTGVPPKKELPFACRST
ncbi:uncharacterized protein [Macrobrachium rosenbergii]|uniref:uncharacterized protein n=1 Tax=Macrobrachium rosenbergii TaxID=79674 RepID=UPI0034D3AFA0